MTAKVGWKGYFQYRDLSPLLLIQSRGGRAPAQPKAAHSRLQSRPSTHDCWQKECVSLTTALCCA